MVHGLNEGHIAPNTDIEFRLTKYQTYIIMKSWNKSLQLIIEEIITLLTKIKRVKQMALKQYFTTGQNKVCIIKKQNKNTTLQYTLKTEHNNISNTVKSIIASKNYNESMCKHALWLAPAPPACTPNHHNNNAINCYKQKASSHDGYRLL